MTLLDIRRIKISSCWGAVDWIMHTSIRIEGLFSSVYISN